MQEISRGNQLTLSNL